MESVLFCVSSPLQAICACEALKYYHVMNYTFIVLNNGRRTKQIESYLSSLNIDFISEPYHPSNLESIRRIYRVFNSNKSKYDVLFFGDYRLISAKLKYLPFVKNGGKVIYLDDGNYILTYAQGKLKTKITVTIREKIFNIAAKRKNVSINNFYTIYADDISAPHLNIEKNELRSLTNHLSTEQDIILFLGTATNVYCSYLGIPIELFLEKLKTSLIKLKTSTSTSRILFFPHGRDNNASVKTICESLEIEYVQSDRCIELYSLMNHIYPKDIYGFTSTALYTLKFLYPKSKIYNLIIEGGKNEGANKVYQDITETYEKKGIKTIKI